MKINDREYLQLLALRIISDFKDESCRAIYEKDIVAFKGIRHVVDLLLNAGLIKDLDVTWEAEHWQGRIAFKATDAGVRLRAKALAVPSQGGNIDNDVFKLIEEASISRTSSIWSISEKNRSHNVDSNDMVD